MTRPRSLPLILGIFLTLSGLTGIWGAEDKIPDLTLPGTVKTEKSPYPPVKLGLGTGFDLNFNGQGEKFQNNGGYEYNSNTFGMDFGVFLDCTYGLFLIDGQGVLAQSDSNSTPSGSSGSGDTHRASYLDLSAYGKYPFVLNEDFTLFPLAGFSLAVNTNYAGKDSMGDKQQGNLNKFSFTLGGGLDYSLDKVFDKVLPQGFFVRGLYRLEIILNPGLQKAFYDDQGTTLTKYSSLGLASRLGFFAGYRF